jgi:NADH-quinone oxidoreductase subunit N
LSKQPLALLPELVLLLGAVVTLLLGSFLPRRRQWVARGVTALVLLGSLGAAVVTVTVNTADGTDRLVYAASYGIDGPTLIARLVVPAAALLVLGLAVDEVDGAERETEFYVLLLVASLGSVALAGASDLSLLVVAYLLSSVPLYALAGGSRSSAGTEAALKLYLLGAFLGVSMLLGVTLLYGVAGGTTYRDLGTGLPGAPAAAVALGLVGVLAGLMFKAGAVPGHFWVPDAAEGSTPAVAALLTTIPKVGGLLAAYRLLDAVPTSVVDWPLLVALLAAVTMTLGNLAAFAQTHPRRLLGWSTVSQAGYLLMAAAVAGRSDLALPALGLYLAAYAVTNLGAFAVTAALPSHDRLELFRGLAFRRPLLAGALLVCLLGLVGTPPTAVFVGKLTVFTAALDGGLAWLVVVAALNTVASLYYYLRWAAPAFERSGSSGAPPVAARPWAATSALLAAVGTLVLGVAAGLALDTDLSIVR